MIRQVGPGVPELQPGDRVSMISSGLCRTRMRLNHQLVTILPDEVSLQDAAAMGVVYMTALYSLVNVGNLQKEQVSPSKTEERPSYSQSLHLVVLHSPNSSNSPF